MATVQTSPLIHYLRQFAAATLPADLSDAQLLRRFVCQRDEAAFAALVRRHGPLVHGVCRRVLRDWHLAQDCFQVTFLVLARKAGSLRQPDALGPWLYGVASRTARKAKAQEMRRRQKERQVQAAEAVEDPANTDQLDLRSVLDEIVSGLPDKYRVPFVLHYMQGVTVTEVAQRLGCPRGSVATRLARARQQLRRRLARRGLALSAGCLMAALSEASASVPAPISLAVSTTRAAALVAAGQAAGPGLISPWAAALSEGVLQGMQTAKIKIAFAVCLVLALIGAGAGAVWHRTQAADEGEARRDKAPENAIAPRKDVPQESHFRFLSLAEARAIALEQGTFVQPPLPSPGAGSIQAPRRSGSIRVLAGGAPGGEGILVTGIRRNVPRAELERNINQLLLNVAVAYWNLYGSYWQLHSREQGLRFAYEAWKIVGAKYKVGRVSLADFAQAEGQYNLFRSQRLQAIDTVLDNERRLRALLGMPIEDDTRLVPSDTPTLVEKKPDWEKAWPEALKNRPELRLAREDVQKAQTNEENQKETSRARLVLQDQEMKAERFLGLYYRRMFSAYAQIKAARAQRVAFAAQVRVRSEKYRTDSKPPTGPKLDLLLEAQRFWADALATECQAIATYNSAMAGFEYAKGSILAHAHVSLADEPPADSDKVRAVVYQRKRTRMQVRQELAVPADSSLSPVGVKTAEVDEKSVTTPSLPALWKRCPPLQEVASLPAAAPTSKEEVGQADTQMIEWKKSDLFPADQGNAKPSR